MPVATSMEPAAPAPGVNHLPYLSLTLQMPEVQESMRDLHTAMTTIAWQLSAELGITMDEAKQQVLARWAADMKASVLAKGLIR